MTPNTQKTLNSNPEKGRQLLQASVSSLEEARVLLLVTQRLDGLRGFRGFRLKGLRLSVSIAFLTLRGFTLGLDILRPFEGSL